MPLALSATPPTKPPARVSAVVCFFRNFSSGFIPAGMVGRWVGGRDKLVGGGHRRMVMQRDRWGWGWGGSYIIQHPVPWSRWEGVSVVSGSEQQPGFNPSVDAGLVAGRPAETCSVWPQLARSSRFAAPLPRSVGCSGSPQRASAAPRRLLGEVNRDTVDAGAPAPGFGELSLRVFSETNGG